MGDSTKVQYPGRSDLGGYVYILAFRSGTVKVGKADNPHLRIGHHERHAKIHADELVQAWVSEPHPDPHLMEQHLVGFCRAVGKLVGGNEYFRGVSFHEVVQFASTLDYSAQRARRYSVREGESARDFIQRGMWDTNCWMTFGASRKDVQAAIDSLKTMTWAEAKELVRRRRERDRLEEMQNERFLRELFDAERKGLMA